MAYPTLNWTVNRERGTIAFGRLLPLTGNTYALSVSGGETGETLTFSVMDESGETCLAKSVTEDDATTIAFDTDDIRKEFSGDWHEVKSFHCVCSNGSATIAEGDVSVIWNPVWTDRETGKAYSMKGDPGATITGCDYVETDVNGNYVYDLVLSDGTTVRWTAPRGSTGIITAGSVRDSATGLYHDLVVYTNRHGEKMVTLSQTGHEAPDVSNLVTTDEVQTISGAKTFTGGIVGNLTGDVTGNVSGSSGSTDKLSTARKFTVSDNDGTNTQESDEAFDGSAAITIKLPAAIKADVTGDVTGNVTGDVTGSVDVPEGDSLSVAGSAAISGELDATKVKDVEVGITIADQAVTKAMSEKSVWDLIALIAPYLNANWVYTGEAALPEGFNGSTETKAVASQYKWREQGISYTRATGNSTASGLFGFRTTEIEKYACYSPEYLKQISFPNVTSIGKYAFYDADELERIDVPLVESIGDYAFYTAPYLGGVNLPKCRNIGASAFYGSFGSVTGVALDIGTEAEKGTSADDYNTIGASAFAGITNSKITRINCPNTQVFGASAFANQRNVAYFDISGAVTIGDKAFYWLNYGKTDSEYKFDLDLPYCRSIGVSAFGTASSTDSIQTIKSLTAPMLTSIGATAFYYELALKTVKCDALTTIGANAFHACTALETVDATSITDIGASAFSGCTSLTEIVLPNIAAIGASAFSGCTKLMSVVLSGKTIADVQAMSNYSWGLPTGCVITCSDGTITI